MFTFIKKALGIDTRKPIAIEVIKEPIMCGCGLGEAIPVEVYSFSSIDESSAGKPIHETKHLCKECIKLECACGHMIALL